MADPQVHSIGPGAGNGSRPVSEVFGWSGRGGPEAEDRAETFVAHAYPEQLVDLGEIRLN